MTCEICGAVVQDEELHAEWHESLRTVLTGVVLLAESGVTETGITAIKAAMK